MEDVFTQSVWIGKNCFFCSFSTFLSILIFFKMYIKFSSVRYWTCLLLWTIFWPVQKEKWLNKMTIGQQWQMYFMGKNSSNIVNYLYIIITSNFPKIDLSHTCIGLIYIGFLQLLPNPFEFYNKICLK